MDINPAKLAEHCKDADSFDLPGLMGGHIHLPEILGLQVTKFMVLEVVAAVLMILIFVPLGQRIATGQPPRGRFWNVFEAMILFIRDEMVRPAIGGKQADRFLPLIWTLFFFILFCNLLGLVPWAGSPTGSLACTGALATIALCSSVGAGMKKFGVLGFWTGLAPQMELPLVLTICLKPMILGIEVGGLFIKHTVLAVRLLANIFAGHLVLAVIIGFVAAFAGKFAWYGVLPASVLGATALSLLELFVAFLQAYVFAFLAALFIGMSVHRH